MSASLTQSAAVRARYRRLAAVLLQVRRLAALPARLLPASLRARGLILITLSAASVLIPAALAVATRRAYPDRSPALLLFGMAFAGLAVGVAWFHLAIERPIRRLAQYLAATEAGTPRPDIAPAAATDLSAMLRQASIFHDELRRARADAICLRASLEARVDARTRQAALVARRAERAAGTDTLTGLENRRVLERVLPHLFTTRQAERADLALVLIDLDHFKCLNDRLGHAAGDALLTFTGDLLRGALRPGKDRAIRLGGDEFVLILPDLSAEAAQDLAARLAALFAQKARTLNVAEPRPGLSVGIASLRRDYPANWHELLRLADRAMYKAKYQARSRR
jgi:diguanylate cyclase (GGDEF)-like protein